MKAFRRGAGLIASMLVAGMGCLLLFSGVALAGILLFLGGLALAVWQAIVLVRTRPDPYDLSKLWDAEPEPDEEPDEDWGDDKSLGFCHNCGQAVPEPYAWCPDCGTLVR